MGHGGYGGIRICPLTERGILGLLTTFGKISNVMLQYVTDCVHIQQYILRHVVLLSSFFLFNT